MFLVLHRPFFRPNGLFLSIFSLIPKTRDDRNFCHAHKMVSCGICTATCAHILYTYNTPLLLRLSLVRIEFLLSSMEQNPPRAMSIRMHISWMMVIRSAPRLAISTITVGSVLVLGLAPTSITLRLILFSTIILLLKLTLVPYKKLTRTEPIITLYGQAYQKPSTSVSFSEQCNGLDPCELIILN